jgi:GTPase-activating protein SAC7
LKSWWKTFGKNTKNQDTHGKSSPTSLQQPLRHQNACQPPSQPPQYPLPCFPVEQNTPPYIGELYTSREFTPVISRGGPIGPKLTEHPMIEDSLAIDGLPSDEDENAHTNQYNPYLRDDTRVSSSTALVSR